MLIPMTHRPLCTRPARARRSNQRFYGDWGSEILNTVDGRVQRRRDAKQLLKLSANDLVDSGWTRHDVVASNVRWGKLLKGTARRPWSDAEDDFARRN